MSSVGAHHPALHPVERRTLAGAAEVAGPGLFTGKSSTLRMVPAEPGYGLRFVRVDLPDRPTVWAHIDNVGQPPPGVPDRNTTLSAGGRPFVMTTEHVLSALAGLGITDARLELDGLEVPIADGSALPFVAAIRGAGVRTHGQPLRPFAPTRTHTVVSRAGDPSSPSIEIRPRTEPGATFSYAIDYGADSPIAASTVAHELGAGDYAAEVAPARTFCLEAEANAMRAAGLFTHLTPRDMLVLGPRGPIDNTLRFADEPARHKLLDLIGDLALLAIPLQADVVAVRSGHALARAAAALLARARSGVG